MFYSKHLKKGELNEKDCIAPSWRKCMEQKRTVFTGWTDVDLTEKGIAEACKAGELLKENGFNFDKSLYVIP